MQQNISDPLIHSFVFSLMNENRFLTMTCYSFSPTTVTIIAICHHHEQQPISSYIYKKEVNVSSVSNALTLILVAHQFMLHDLTRCCLEFLISKTCPSNVLEILSWLGRPPPYNAVSSSPSCDSLLTGDNILDELISKCYSVLDLNAEEILRSPESLELMNHDLLMDILSRDSLCLTSEAVIFDCVIAWANQQCLKQRKPLTGENRRVILGQGIYSVRYCVMNLEEFMRGPYSSDILTDEEKRIFASRLRQNADQPIRSSSSCGERSATPSMTDPLPAYMMGHRMDIPRNYQKPYVESIKTILKKEVQKGALNVEPRKKTASKKIMNGLSGFMICVIQLLD